MQSFRNLNVPLLLLSLPTASFAHHGRDFLLTQTAHIPMQGSIYGISHLNYFSGEEDEVEFEPALLIGGLDWFSAEIHGHIEKLDGESAKLESVAPELHFRFSPRKNAIALGASIEYEIPKEDDENEVLKVTAIASYERDKWQAALNLSLENELNSSEDERWGYAVGVRRMISDGHAIGAETLGSFEKDDANEVVVGYYWESSEHVTLNVGVGTGGKNGPDWSLRTALIWQFR